MLLEKIRNNSGKIMFFGVNILLVAVGVLFLKQNDVEKANSAIAEADVQNYKLAADYALGVQQAIKADNAAKTSSIANNSDTIKQQQVVSVTRTIPAVTKKVTVQKSSGGGSSAQTTTKKS